MARPRPRGTVTGIFAAIFRAIAAIAGAICATFSRWRRPNPVGSRAQGQAVGGRWREALPLMVDEDF